ncbi:MAG: glycerol kinase [Lachnospiraceae bacterium]|nr:glycerol kinase [Lachnospiraceae bacterium]
MSEKVTARSKDDGLVVCEARPVSYIISIDQSTQGTKALLFDEKGKLLGREDLPHRQIVNDLGWASHDPEEIYANTIQVVRRLLQSARIAPEHVAALGISNQRETSLVWEKATGRPIADAVVWQCARAAGICERVRSGGSATKDAVCLNNAESLAGENSAGENFAVENFVGKTFDKTVCDIDDLIRRKTGLTLSPYFSAAKLAWILENTEGAKKKAARHELCMGTIDTWLLFKMTGGKAYKTDYSNASRTQLFNIFDLKWDEEICGLFGIDPNDLAEVCDSNSRFGETDLGGTFPQPIPICGVLGDSHGALFGQGCLEKGMIKATYGTGSSIMMNIGETPVLSTHGVVTSLAWGMDGKVNYCLEGNINYTGAVISWLKEDVGLIASAGETEGISEAALKDDSLYFIPAFTGLGAPYWDSAATGSLSGITRTTGKNEIVRACVECIAYQIADVIEAMSTDSDLSVKELRVDGGPTRNSYLMQFTSDILDANVLVPETEELSGIGAAYAAGIGCGLYGPDIFDGMRRKVYCSKMPKRVREKKTAGWKNAVKRTLTKA